MLTMQEWIAIGVDKGIVEVLECEEKSFDFCYRLWFCMKMKSIHSQSLDRIECTFNRYYKDSDLVHCSVSAIDETVIIDFLTAIIINSGGLTKKEFSRVYQIVNNVMRYCRDLKIGGAKLIDWERIRRYIPDSLICDSSPDIRPLTYEQTARLFHSVIIDKIYELKQSACLCILLNFYLGLRIGELSSLTWNDIDLERKILYVSHTEIKYYVRDENGERVGSMQYCVQNDVKTVCSLRTVPLTDEALYLIGLIREHHHKCGYSSPYLAYDGTDTILVRSLDRTLRRLCVLCEVPHFNSHLIRKTLPAIFIMRMYQRVLSLICWVIQK